LIDISNVSSRANKQSIKIEQVRIIDKMGQIKKIITGNKINKMSITIADLPSNNYIIMVYDGKVWLSKQIIKN
jgi:hypothetical protein